MPHKITRSSFKQIRIENHITLLASCYKSNINWARHIKARSDSCKKHKHISRQTHSFLKVKRLHLQRKCEDKYDISDTQYSSLSPLSLPTVLISRARRHTTSFPGSLFSASLGQTTNGGREERPWERGWASQYEMYVTVRVKNAVRMRGFPASGA